MTFGLFYLLPPNPSKSRTSPNSESSNTSLPIGPTSPSERSSNKSICFLLLFSDYSYSRKSELESFAKSRAKSNSLS